MKELVGIERVDYTNKSGKQVQGVRIHVLSSLFTRIVSLFFIFLDRKSVV